MANETGERTGTPAGRDTAAAGYDETDDRSQFERLRDYLTAQLGAVRKVEAGQQSAERLLQLAEGELGDLKREFAAARLGVAKR